MNLFEKLKDTKKKIASNKALVDRNNNIQTLELLLSKSSQVKTIINNNELFELIRLSNQYRDVVDNYLEEPKKSNNTFLTSNELFDITREIISSIVEAYVKEFDSFVDEKRIELKVFNKSLYKNELTVDKSCYLIANSIPKEAYIKLNRSFGYMDVVRLVHEFMHHTNVFLNNKDDERVNKYTEFISIYFEKYAIDYLINEKCVNSNEIDLTPRLNDTRSLTNVIYSMLIVYLYKKNKHIKYDDFNKYIKDNNLNINPKMFDIYLKDLINILNNDEYLFERLNKCKTYFLCTLLVFSSKEGINKENVIEFNKSLISKTYDKDKIKVIEDLYGSVFDDETIFINLKKYINDLQKRKIKSR